MSILEEEQQRLLTGMQNFGQKKGYPIIDHE